MVGELAEGPVAAESEALLESAVQPPRRAFAAAGVGCSPPRDRHSMARGAVRTEPRVATCGDRDRDRDSDSAEHGEAKAAHATATNTTALRDGIAELQRARFFNVKLKWRLTELMYPLAQNSC